MTSISFHFFLPKAPTLFKHLLSSTRQGLQGKLASALGQQVDQVNLSTPSPRDWFRSGHVSQL